VLSNERNNLLSATGRGTPMGELLRRYWHPVAGAAEFREQDVKPVRLFGEDLALFRDRSGNYGLVDRHCPHRRADMTYGFVEDRGLRCNYHGWLFDHTGRCLHQPFEETRHPEGSFRDKVRINAYQVKEKAGLLCLEGVPVSPAVDWPEHRLISPRGEVARRFGWSGLVRMASERRAPRFLLDKRVASQLGDALKSLPFRIIDRTSTAAVENRIGQLEDILGALDRTIRGDGKGFGVLVFPSARMYAGKAADESRDYREILGVLNRLDIPFVDYYEHTKDSQWQDLFYKMDGHWRPAGHEEAATLLRTLLLSRGTRSASPPGGGTGHAGD